MKGYERFLQFTFNTGDRPAGRPMMARALVKKALRRNVFANFPFITFTQAEPFQPHHKTGWMSEPSSEICANQNHQMEMSPSGKHGRPWQRNGKVSPLIMRLKHTNFGPSRVISKKYFRFICLTSS